MLGAARLAGGATAAAIVPLSMAFIGDHVPYERRQTALARFLTGTILGIVSGQVLGGVLGEMVGWRAVFLLLGAVFLLIGALLLVEVRSTRVPPPLLTGSISLRSLAQRLRRCCSVGRGRASCSSPCAPRRSCSMAPSPSSAPICTTVSASTTRPWSVFCSAAWASAACSMR